jgi:hypothetical protein
MFIVDDDLKIELDVEVRIPTSNGGGIKQDFIGIFRDPDTEEVRELMAMIRSSSENFESYEDYKASDQYGNDIAGFADRFLEGVKNVGKYKKNDDGTYVTNEKNERVTAIVSSEEGLQIILKGHRSAMAAGQTFIDKILFPKSQQGNTKKGR